MRLWEPWHKVIAPGKVLARQELVSNRDFECLEIYNEVMRPTRRFLRQLLFNTAATCRFHRFISMRVDCAGPVDSRRRDP